MLRLSTGTLVWLELWVFGAFSTSIVRFNVPKITTSKNDVLGKWQNCSRNEYAVAFNVKSYRAEDKNRFTDEGLSGVCLYCASLGQDLTNKSKQICSKVGPYGKFNDIPFQCDEHVLNGFSLYTDLLLNNADQRSVGNIKFSCSNKMEIEANGRTFGYGYYSWQKCLQGQAICGIRTLVQMPTIQASEILKPKETHFFINATGRAGLVNIEMKCCDVRHLTQMCVPKDKWEQIRSCDNTNGKTKITCKYMQTTGTSMLNTARLSRSETQVVETLTSLSISTGGGIGELKASFEARGSVGTSSSTGIQWEMESESVFSEAATREVEFTVPPGFKTVLFQIVGTCGPYSVHTNRLYRIDTTSNTMKVFPPPLLPSGFFCDKDSAYQEMNMNFMPKP